MATPFKVKAVFEYTSPHDDDLHFPNGQIITVTEEEDEDWYVGEYTDASGVKQEGIFPRNFVEKYEPTAPPRPTRTARPKKEAEPIQAPVELPAEPERDDEPEEEEDEAPPASVARQPSPPPQVVKSPPAPRAAEVVPTPASNKSTPSASKPAPPPVSDKPSGNSFRDRIAAFNKAAPPPAPFKPGGLGGSGSSNFIKKPFVAPPPSKNAYVPPPREPVPQKLYRRDEDPEITARETENQEQAERAGLVPSNDADAEDQPKPTSLKERIALLQKQQAEQASRHADAASKKEKPKRPAKKRTESHNTLEQTEETSLEVPDNEEAVGKPSMDSVREETAPRRRKSSAKPAPTTPGVNPRKSFGDGNEADMSGAGETTEEPEEISTGRDDSDDKPKSRAPTFPPRGPLPIREPEVREEEEGSEAGEENVEEDDDEDIDPEVRRKEELRARMAKMSGGMGMHGMFGAPMPPMPQKKKSTGPPGKQSGEYGAEDRPAVRMVPMPGMSQSRSPEEEDDDEDPTPVSRHHAAEEVPDIEDVVPTRSAAPPVPSQEYGAPPIPGGRPAPPPVPKEATRPVPPPPTKPMSPSAGSESDDEMSENTQTLSLDTPGASLKSPPAAKRASYFGSEAIPGSPTTPGLGKEKRASKVPPIPGAAPASVPQNRAPPPPPPTGPLSRSSTGDKLPAPAPIDHDLSDEEEVTEYEGDYDTDIASAVPHKDALKAHSREPIFDEPPNIPPQLPMASAPSGPPPLPSVAAPRAIPPPLPSQPPPNNRKSVDMPRAAPPLPPTSKMPAPWEHNDDDYDPFNYSAPLPALGSAEPSPIPQLERRESDLYSASPPRSKPAQDRPPPMPPRDELPVPNRAPPRQSLDVGRGGGPSRRSTDLGRMSMDSGFVANDIDLAQKTYWWTRSNGTPPSLEGRKDILMEFEETSAPGRGGKTFVTKEIFILYQDYSKTVISAKFDAQDPADIKLEQRHEAPPARLRQDQLEKAHEEFGRIISEAVQAKKETVVGDGTPQGLIIELLKPLTHALGPVGTRCYGAVVYSNLANASTQQNDEIRPGDIITLRNTKFQGKHGPMHAKYSMEVGKKETGFEHVGVVAEWDGTKKKVRAWEQGRESKKVKMESFKLGDLKGGEVKIWRVMGRGWVGWER